MGALWPEAFRPLRLCRPVSYHDVVVSALTLVR